MDICHFPSTAIRIRERTLDLIAAMNGGVAPEIAEKPTFFVIYCRGSHHSETDIMDEETFTRLHGHMPDHEDTMLVTPID